MCPIGYFSAEVTHTCTVCSSGRYQNKEGQPFCFQKTPCRPGTYDNSSGKVLTNARCGLCPANYFRLDTDEKECLPCPRNTLQKNKGQFQCDTVTPGYPFFVFLLLLLLCLFVSFLIPLLIHRFRLQRISDGSSIHQRVEEIPCPVGTYFNPSAVDGCSDCPPGSLCPSGTVSPMHCKPYHYVAEFVECVRCPHAIGFGDDASLDCRDGMLEYRGGYWRDGLTSAHGVPWTHSTASSSQNGYHPSIHTKFYRCPASRFCHVNSSNGDIKCLENTRGPLCAACPEDSYRSSKGDCRTCKYDTSQAYAPACVVGVVVLAALLARRAWHRRTIAKNAAVSRKMARLLATVSVKFKLMLAYFQVVSLVGSVFEVPFPTWYREWMVSLSVFSLNIFDMLPFSCMAGGFNFHSRLFLAAFAGIILQVVVVLMYVLYRLRKGNDKDTGKDTSSSVLGWALFLLFLVYPPTSSTTFEAFNCNDLGKMGKYLRSDYTINCDGTQHALAEAIAWTTVVSFALGVPLLFLALIHHDRNAKFLRFFCDSYHPRYYYWECIDIVKKLLLVGFAVMFKRGSLVQLACGILVALAYFALVLQCDPYKDGGSLSKSSSLMLVLSLFGALLVKVSDGNNQSVYEEGYTSTFVAGFVLALNFLVIAQTGIEVLSSTYELREQLSAGGSRSDSKPASGDAQKDTVGTEGEGEGAYDGTGKVDTKDPGKVVV